MKLNDALQKSWAFGEALRKWTLQIVCALGLLLPTFSSAATFNLVAGWNLVGNSGATALDVAQYFGDASNTASVWKWNPRAKRWAFYTPSLSAASLFAYTQSKGFDVLTSIDSKEGFWVNMKAPVVVTGPVADGVKLTQIDIQVGWNLVSSTDNKTPSQLNAVLSSSLNRAGKNIAATWGWDTESYRWRLYAPELEAQGSAAASAYLAAHGYLLFSMPLASTDGFWVNASAIAATANTTPVAQAGLAQNVVAGSAVTLDGSSSSDADGDPLTYAWALTAMPAGSLANLSASTSAKPTLTPDLAGAYVASLVVNDGTASSTVATVTVTATAAWQAQSSSKIFTALPVSSDDTVNPLRGYYRWRGQEKVTQVSPALDAYQRYRWNDLETGLGIYNFATVLSDLQLAKSQGRKYALRVQMMLGYDDGKIYMPSYLVNHPSCQRSCGWWADADTSTPGLTFVPDWNDPYLQQRASALLQALSTALGSQEDIAWIDIGLFGQYGEWALSSRINYATAPAGITVATDASKREFVDMHLRAFSTRQMVMLAIYSRYNEVRYATTQQTIASKPVGMRIDCLGRGGFMNQWTNHPTEWATLQNVWKTAPFVAEYCQFLSGDTVDSAAVALQQVRDFHISTVGNGNIGDGSVNSWTSFTPTEQQQFIQIGREAGYRYRVDTANVSLSDSGLLTVSAVVRNEGNAPSYEPWDVVLELTNGNGFTVWTQVLGGDLKTSQGGGTSQSFATTVQLPTQAAGDYSLKLISRDGRRQSATPVRAPLRWTVVERNSDGGVSLGTLSKN